MKKSGASRRGSLVLTVKTSFALHQNVCPGTFLSQLSWLQGIWRENLTVSNRVLKDRQSGEVGFGGRRQRKTVISERAVNRSNSQ